MAYSSLDKNDGGRGASLGPCAESVGLSGSIVFSFAVLQLPAMFVATLHYPAAKADIYATAARLVFDPQTNHTSVDLHDPIRLHYTHSVHISLLFVLCSALVCLVSVTTMYIMDKGIDNNKNVRYETYTADNTELITHPTMSMWNNIFLCLAVGFHVLLLLVVNSPCSMHFILLNSLLCYVSLQIILQPRLQAPPEAGQGAASAVAGIYMFAVCLFVAAMGYIASNISHDPHSYKVELVAAVAFIDIFLLVFGHIWDPVPNMQTVLNCRLLYAITVSAVAILVYVSWHDCFRVHYFDTS